MNKTIKIAFYQSKSNNINIEFVSHEIKFVQSVEKKQITIKYLNVFVIN